MSVEHIGEVARMATVARKAIQRIVLNLNEELIDYGVRVDAVNVDTRRFANMAVDICIEDGRL